MTAVPQANIPPMTQQQQERAQLSLIEHEIRSEWRGVAKSERSRRCKERARTRQRQVKDKDAQLVEILKKTSIEEGVLDKRLSKFRDGKRPTRRGRKRGRWGRTQRHYQEISNLFSNLRDGSRGSIPPQKTRPSVISHRQSLPERFRHQTP